MFSQFKSLTFIGVSNPEMFLSEKDLNSMEFNFLVRPALEFEDHECDIARLREGDDDQDELHLNNPKEEEKEGERKREEHKEGDQCKLLVSTLKIKLPSLGEFKLEEDVDEDDGFKTPTSLDNKIPVVLPCPPAPRKPKSLPSNKRKSHRRRVLLDLSNEIESLFPPALRADLGGKIKKIRQENDSNGIII
ncbi:cyclin-dependent protein kinase inhibitor SMR10 [Manihot esculenta]|uniref:Cyclin-dependent protein kinase inhibitor SMR3 n=1 Tax=Manihot esculenta TaxID=3983 RepID=A0A2C9V263_MANES|nr:cyclin-dependent protein kinase inhibitor SMR10 [Manihot esculenta]OAY37816.1 hypothetical protein MANES_11G131200v8 [Manihot esculenta]